jgi:hypothetical protein
MEKYFIEKDITVFYVEAKSFPDGVKDAFDKAYSLVANDGKRKIFGLSRPEPGKGISYKAAVEEIFTGEAEQLHCKKIVIKSGQYISTMVHDFMKDLPSIGTTFQQLLQTPGLDPEGYCVEWYLNDKDVRCMVRLKS